MAAAVLVAPAVPPLERLQNTAENGEMGAGGERDPMEEIRGRRSLPWSLRAARRGVEAPGRGGEGGEALGLRRRQRLGRD